MSAGIRTTLEMIPRLNAGVRPVKGEHEPHHVSQHREDEEDVSQPIHAAGLQKSVEHDETAQDRD
jgi:hypothetical protein